MKIRKLTQGLVVVPLVGAASLLGTPPAIAADCSGLLSCTVSSVPAAQSLTLDVKVSQDLNATVDPAQTAKSALAPVAPMIDAVKAPVKDAAAPITAPAKDTVVKITAPIVGRPTLPPVPVVPIEPLPVDPVVPVKPIAPPVAAVVPVAEAAAGINNATGVGDAGQAKGAPVAAVSAATQVHNSAANSGGLDKSRGTDSQAPRLLDAEPTALHSAEGTMTKYWDSGMFGFGHVDPVDAPRGVGLAFAYFITLGTTIGFAIKKNAFALARKVS